MRSKATSKVFLWTAILIFTFAFKALPISAEEAATSPEAAATEEEAVISGGVEADVNSVYLWRGLAFTKGATFNPSAWITAYYFTLSTWGNYIMTDEANEGQFNEMDVYFTFAYDWKKFSYEASYFHYFLYNQDGAPDTGEVSMALSYSISDFSIFTTHTVDVVEYDGAYFAEGGLGYGHEFSDKMSVEARVYAGFGNGKFNETYFGPDKDLLDMAGADVSFLYYPLDFFYVRPHGSYSSLLNKDLRDAVDHPDVVNGGIAVGLEF